MVTQFRENKARFHKTYAKEEEEKWRETSVAGTCGREKQSEDK